MKGAAGQNADEKAAASNTTGKKALQSTFTAKYADQQQDQNNCQAHGKPHNGLQGHKVHERGFPVLVVKFSGWCGGRSFR